MEPTFFATPADFRAWLERHHDSVSELLVGFHKKSSGRPSITWPAAVDQALCFGWIDVNVKRMTELIAEGLVAPAGLAAFERRSDDRAAIYAYEQRRTAQLEPEQEQRLRADEGAYSYFESQPPHYRRAAIHWVTSAKKPETRERRLTQLIECSAEGRTVPP